MVEITNATTTTINQPQLRWAFTVAMCGTWLPQCHRTDVDTNALLPSLVVSFQVCFASFRKIHSNCSKFQPSTDTPAITPSTDYNYPPELALDEFITEVLTLTPPLFQAASDE